MVVCNSAPCTDDSTVLAARAMNVLIARYNRHPGEVQASACCTSHEYACHQICRNHYCQMYNYIIIL